MTDWNAELFVKLYSKLALALGVTSDSSPKPAATTDDPAQDVIFDAFGPDGPPRPSRVFAGVSNPQYLLAIYNPGQYIPADMNPATDVDDQYALSVLFDVVPQFSWVFKPAATTVSNAYKSVLDSKETPLASLTPEQKTRLEAAQTDYEQYIEGYNVAQEAYFVALDAYDSAKATASNGGAPIPRSAKLRLESAYKNWVANHKEAVDAAVAVIGQYEALEPASFWFNLLERYRSGNDVSTTGSTFQRVGFAPPYASWFKGAGWTKFTFDQKDMANQSRSQAIGAAGNLDGTFGIVKVSGAGNYQQDESYVKIDETDLTFSCDLMRISLDRSWMNPLVFYSSAWRFQVGSAGVQLSSGGDIAGDVPPTGAMTVIPTAAILSRNLAIAGTFNNTVVESLNRSISANASVGIGPFAIAGRFNMDNKDGSQKGSIATNKIEAKDVQIVALICEVLPRCPNPDNTLPWPK